MRKFQADEDTEDLIEAIEAAGHHARITSWARIAANKVCIRLWGGKFFVITIEEIAKPPVGTLEQIDEFDETE